MGNYNSVLRIVCRFIRHPNPYYQTQTKSRHYHGNVGQDTDHPLGKYGRPWLLKPGLLLSVAEYIRGPRAYRGHSDCG